ncbi:hypothetical protein CDAR_305461, partial [Caerostris darwini]
LKCQVYLPYIQKRKHHIVKQ